MTAVDLGGPPEQVAERLLGTHLLAGDVEVRIVDVEAYGGADDPASHAHRGRTKRNSSMFGRPGLLYVYLIYGLHHCANVVCGEVGQPSAVLIRGVEVVAGATTVRDRRARETRDGRLDGPGRVCKGLGIDRRLDGTDLLAPTAPVRLAPGAAVTGESVVAGPRIGITKETERPWRFRIVETQEER